MKKQLWLLKAMDTIFNEDVLVVASSQKEAEARWDTLFEGGDYIGRIVIPISRVDNHKIIVEQIIK